MADEMIPSRTGALVNAMDSQGLGEMLRPLIREIHLFDTYVAGTTHLADESALDAISVGDRLTLQREDSRFDENAIALFTEDHRKLGYIPEKDNVIFARLMDAGKLLAARVRSHELRGSFHQISVGIYLVDF